MFKKACKFIGIGVAIFMIVAFFRHQGWLMGIQNSLQNKFYDYDSASSEIVIVTIDEKTLSPDELGPLQKWARASYARAIEALNKAGAAAIGIDVTFPDDSFHGPADDQIFADTLRSNRNVVLAGRYYFENGLKKTELPNKTLMTADPEIGWINVQQDLDGFVRQVPLFVGTDGLNSKIHEALSLSLARIYLGQPQDQPKVEGDLFAFSDKIKIPVITKRDPRLNQDFYFMYVNYFAEPGKFTRLSFSDLIKGKMTDSHGNKIDLKDKVVLIGPTAVDLQDDYLSPVSSGIRMPGVEIHANNIQTIISEKFLTDQSARSFWIMIGLTIALGILIFGWLKIRYSVPIFLIAFFGFILSGIIGYELHLFINIVYPLLTLILTFSGTFVLRYTLEQKERKFIQNAFGHYVNPQVVSEIVKNPKMLELGGAKKEITVFFSDIEGFTTVSEHLDPTALVALLNEYLKEMTDIILSHKGTLDKYVGDAIMAFWNAPMPDEDHAKKACKAALENQKRLKELRGKWKKEGKPELNVRIGINTGEAIVGNMGSLERFDYTAIGDNVNLGSRLEGINKQYDTNIILAEGTYSRVKTDFVCRELDKIRVKGKNEPVRIYELVGGKNEVPATKLKEIETFEYGLKLYRSKNFLAAQKEFMKLPNDPVAAIFIKRCADYLTRPPEGDWDGVYTFKTK